MHARPEPTHFASFLGWYQCLSASSDCFMKVNVSVLSWILKNYRLEELYGARLTTTHNCCHCCTSHGMDLATCSVDDWRDGSWGLRSQSFSCSVFCWPTSFDHWTCDYGGQPMNSVPSTATGSSYFEWSCLHELTVDDWMRTCSALDFLGRACLIAQALGSLQSLVSRRWIFCGVRWMFEASPYYRHHCLSAWFDSQAGSWWAWQISTEIAYHCFLSFEWKSRDCWGLEGISLLICW